MYFVLWSPDYTYVESPLRGVKLYTHLHTYRIGDGKFDTSGVVTDSNITVDGKTSVHCLASHATSFAVLVDVGGGLQVIQTITLLYVHSYLC